MNKPKTKIAQLERDLALIKERLAVLEQGAAQLAHAEAAEDKGLLGVNWASGQYKEYEFASFLRMLAHREHRARIVTFVNRLYAELVTNGGDCVVISAPDWTLFGQLEFTEDDAALGSFVEVIRYYFHRLGVAEDSDTGAVVIYVKERD